MSKLHFTDSDRGGSLQEADMNRTFERVDTARMSTISAFEEGKEDGGLEENSREEEEDREGGESTPLESTSGETPKPKLSILDLPKTP